ncbi:MAG: DUF177 domain-containing protein [candidate division Zixibacteria bacterium]|nr:DUF177 domain-containing protein [candidate division Zixibacteria bacterium]
MNLDLYSFESFPAEATLELETDNIDLELQGFSFKDLLQLKISIQEVGEEYFCHAYLTVPVEEECCRCLGLFDDELCSDFNFSIKIGKGEAVLSEESDSSDVIHLDAGKSIVDLSGVIREAVMLELPAKPLCDEACRGLCPSCGINLNDESCKCKGEEIDDRWEDLKDLS